ncbi:MAG: formyltransferase family protein [Campylobacterota bacterium]|nr:formyltransferase family protein [Campylobacterota bacterium]
MTKIAILASHNGSGFDTLYNAYKNKLLDIEIVLVISNNQNAKVLQKAQDVNIKNIIVNNKLCENTDETIHNLLKENRCDIVFLSGYMKKISSILTDNFKIINSHPSLLPLYGGSGMYGIYVHEAVISNCETISGVTIHEVNENYDEGKIIVQQSLELDSKESVHSLEKRIKELEKTVIVDGFKKVLSQSNLL